MRIEIEKIKFFLYKKSTFGFFITMVFFVGSILIYQKSFEKKRLMGVKNGKFCVPNPESLILKRFFVFPLFVANCSQNKGLGLDSDLDGLCDNDEKELGYDPLVAQSQDDQLSDLVHHIVNNNNKRSESLLTDPCDTRDLDADLLSNCEELNLQPTIVEGFNQSETERILGLNSLDMNHPDTDEDGYIDGFEFRFAGGSEPFVHNSDDETSALYDSWFTNVSGESQISIDLEKDELDESCYLYKVSGVDSWLMEQQYLEPIIESDQISKLDFIFYGLLSEVDNPSISSHYGARVVSVSIGQNKIEYQSGSDGLQFNRIEGSK